MRMMWTAWPGGLPAGWRRTAVAAVFLLTSAWASSSAQAQSADVKTCRGSSGDAAIAACTRIIDRGSKESKANRAEAYDNRGDAFRAKGDLDRAIADYSAAIRIDPKDAYAYVLRGDAFRAKGDLDQAIADYSETIRIDPKFASAYRKRGSTFGEKGDLDRAMADYSETIRIDPKNAYAYALRGVAFRDKGDLDRAMADYDEAIRIDPKFALAYANRGHTFRDKGDLDRAIADYDEAIRINPKLAFAYLSRGFAFSDKGDLDRAIADYGEAIRIDPKLVRAYINRGVAFEAKGDLPNALKDFEAGLRLEPGNTRAQDKLAQIKAAIDLARRPITVAAATPPASRPAVSSETRVALVIGNSSYRGMSRLENPRRDAKAVAAALRAAGFSKVIEASDLSLDRLRTTIQDFARQADDADWAMVYFAGHGLEIGGVNYLIPVDAQLLSDRDVQFEALPLNALLSALEGAKKLRLVVLDACRNNPFATQMKMTSANRSTGRGLTRIEPDAGTLVVYAARDGQIAQDGDGANSPFATALVKHLTTPGIEIDKMFRYVSDDVMAITGKKQEPYTYGRLSGRENYYFIAPK